MGRGDKRTRRGKIYAGSYGNSRRAQEVGTTGRGNKARSAR